MSTDQSDISEGLPTEFDLDSDSVRQATNRKPGEWVGSSGIRRQLGSEYGIISECTAIYWIDPHFCVYLNTFCRVLHNYGSNCIMKK